MSAGPRWRSGWRVRPGRFSWAARAVMLGLALAFGLGLGPVPVAGTRAGTGLADGNAASARGDWDAAVAAYRRALSEEGPAAGLLQNLGTAWYRKGEPWRAVACWRQGRWLDPRESDLRANLALAASELGAEETEALAALGWIRVEEAGLLAALLGWLWLGAWAWGRWAGRQPGGLDVFRRGTGWGALLAAGVWGAVWWHEAAMPDALVVAREAAVRPSPSAAVKASGTLPLGSEVRVLRSFGAWREVARGGQRQGWMEAAALAGTRPGD